MTKDQVLKHYGSTYKVAQALNISQPSVQNWDRVPSLRQLQIEALTGGALKADAECDKFRLPAPTTEATAQS